MLINAAQPTAIGWWEFDVTYLTIRVLEAVGLAHDRIMPNQRLLGGAAVGLKGDEVAVD